MSRQDAKSAKDEPDLDVDRLAHLVIGAAIEVHRHLGPGYLEVFTKRQLLWSSTFRGFRIKDNMQLRSTTKDGKLGREKLIFSWVESWSWN
jgi:hypothetical protein